MRILVSAYACDPYQGSEPGVGWTAVCRIAREHQVWVLVHTRHEEGWMKARAEGKIPPNVTVRFLGENFPWNPNRFLAHLQSWRSFVAFNKIVLEAARKWHLEVGFDLCHHVTIATWRVASPLWQLPVPFVWGPIGGGGHIPTAFRSMLSPLARGFETARDWSSARSLRCSSFQQCVKEAAVVFAANEETEELLKPQRGDRRLVRLPIASISREKAAALKRPQGPPATGPLRLFAGGNMEGRKGVSLALKALARVAAAGIDFRYTVAGGGPEIPALMKLSERLGLGERVEFHPGFSGDAYVAALHATDVYFLPSFRESTPVTLLEAYLGGCYPVVADTSAQGEIVRLAGGTAVPVTDMDGLIRGLAAAIIDCAGSRAELPAQVEASRERLIAHFDSERYDQAIADAYHHAIQIKREPA